MSQPIVPPLVRGLDEIGTIRMAALPGLFRLMQTRLTPRPGAWVLAGRVPAEGGARLVVLVKADPE